MTFPRRMWLAGLLLTLATCWTSQVGAIDPKFLPGDTELVISLNIKQMLNSEVAKQYKELLDQARTAIEGQIQNNPAAKYLDKAGFDVLRDLHGVTVASNGSKEIDAVFLVIEGKFDAEKLTATAEEFTRDYPDVLKISKIGSTKVFEITPAGEKRIYVALVNDTTLVTSPTLEALKDAIGGSARKGMKENFRSLLKTTSNKQSFSFSATGDALGKLLQDAPGIPNAEAVAGMLQQVDGISAAITLAKDIQFQLGVNAKDEETAKKAVAAGNFGLLTVRTMVQQKAKEDEKWLPVVDVAKTLRITSQGNNIVLRGEVSVDNLERLIKIVPKFNR